MKQFRLNRTCSMMTVFKKKEQSPIRHCSKKKKLRFRKILFVVVFIVVGGKVFSFVVLVFDSLLKVERQCENHKLRITLSTVGTQSSFWIKVQTTTPVSFFLIQIEYTHKPRPGNEYLYDLSQ